MKKHTQWSLIVASTSNDSNCSTWSFSLEKLEKAPVGMTPVATYLRFCSNVVFPFFRLSIVDNDISIRAPFCLLHTLCRNLNRREVTYRLQCSRTPLESHKRHLCGNNSPPLASWISEQPESTCVRWWSSVRCFCSSLEVEVSIQSTLLLSRFHLPQGPSRLFWWNAQPGLFLFSSLSTNWYALHTPNANRRWVVFTVYISSNLFVPLHFS